MSTKNANLININFRFQSYVLSREMAHRDGHIPGRFPTTEERESLLGEMIKFKVLVHEAKKADYDKRPLSDPKIEIHYDTAGREVLKITPPTGIAQLPGQILNTSPCRK